MRSAYNVSEYKNHNPPVKGFIGAILDSINPLDFLYEIASSLPFFAQHNQADPATRGRGFQQNRRHVSFSEAFNVDNSAGYSERVDLGHYRSPSSVPLTVEPQEV